jgi:phosphate transport system permease protein
VIRFINDILLSAPSIVVGLFVYTIVVAQMQHFWLGGRDCAGAAAGAYRYSYHREHAETGAGQPA